MKLEDLLAREAIRHVISGCTTAGDRLRAGEFAACFTRDGVIESEHAPEDRSFRYEGRSAIQAWQERWMLEEGAVHGATFVRHHLSNSFVELTGPASAEARTHWVAWTDVGADHAGAYLDDLCNIDGNWLIARRRVRLEWEADGSLFKPPHGPRHGPRHTGTNR